MSKSKTKILFVFLVFFIFFYNLILMGCTTETQNIKLSENYFFNYNNLIKIKRLDREELIKLFGDSQIKNPFLIKGVIDPSEFTNFYIKFNFKKLTYVKFIKFFFLKNNKEFIYPVTKLQVLDKWFSIYNDKNPESIQELLNKYYLPFKEFKVKNNFKIISFWNLNFSELNSLIISGRIKFDNGYKPFFSKIDIKKINE